MRQNKIKGIASIVISEPVLTKSLKDVQNVQERDGKEPILRILWKDEKSTFLTFHTDFDLQATLNYITFYWKQHALKE